MNIALATTCIALASCIIVVLSMMTARAGIADIAEGPAPDISVSVFGDAVVPLSEQDGAAVVPAAFTGAVSGGALGDDASEAAVDPDTQAVELGMRFSPKSDGTVTAIRFYKTAENTGVHVGTLWNSRGRVLARVTFTAETASGWQVAQLATPVAVSAGSTYVVSYLAPEGHYASAESYFNTAIETDLFTLPARAGVYTYRPGQFPTSNYRNSNYFVDVDMTTASDDEDPTPSPDPEPTQSPEPEPTQSPEPEKAPTGVFADDATPDTVADPDRTSVELGMRFSPRVDGFATSVRFYKSTANSGTHVGTLWGPDGAALARATFSDETASGWQSADFAAPVRLEAGKTYVISYLARTGAYSADVDYFTQGAATPYLSVPAGAGVYAYGDGGYPNNTYRNSNYYVDIRFSPVAGTPQPEPSTSPTPTPTTPAPTPTITPSPTPGPTASPTPDPEPTTEPGTDGAASLDLPQETFWGGASYYSKFPKANAAGWDEDSFFPIAVFFGKPSQAAALGSIGINTYMGAEYDGSSISTITRQGISVLAQDEWSPSEVGDDPRVVGWHVSDECEMGYSGCLDANDQYERLAVQKRKADKLAGYHDGRFLQANFGNGVLGTFWAPNTMDDHVALMDVTSVDKYAYTSPHVQDLFRDTPSWPSGKNPASAEAYGWQQDRMETYMSPRASKPNWVFVETAKPFLTESGAKTITGAQIEGAVWNSLIHGAGGIAYFQHNNDGKCGTYSLVQCSVELRNKVASINSQVTALAPVLNSPSYTWRFGDGLDTALKAHGGYAYIIAMTDGGSGEREFTLPGGIAGTSVEVVNENRAIRVDNGVFRDDFAAESTHHIYRIAIDD